MSKRKKNYNVRHKPGSRFDKIVPDKKLNARLRPISTDAGAIITDSPLNLLIYTVAVMALLFTLKLIFR